ncbi:MAG: quinoprotein dehydrogenase-associated SoxYZ-like carrier [Methylobacteriaceae bacterium]|nr:quinoprotein dehydrogenase-associated SoxYZ-like carrier [Methylobacteriaceae bacterium]MBV9393209.1 quinoprotein dehydrogenase-associated SoxYZ-like carrier [Methylobacteriaceae bacterium]
MRASFLSSLAGGVLALAIGFAGDGNAQSPAPPDPWPSLAGDLFHDRPMQNGDSLIALEAPYRAEDAALVPMTLRFALPQGDRRQVKRVTLVIDQNPAPMAASFEIGPNSGLTSIATRLRVNDYTNVHEVAELSDGNLYVVEKYVKAAGGCSAPAGKNPNEANAHLGEMRLREIAATPNSPSTPALREAQLMIRHPNNSGLQMDQVSHLYIPARYIDSLKVFQGDDLVFAMEGGISISEDPNFRFNYKPNGAKIMRVVARDSGGKEFRSEWPIGGEM